MSGECWRRGPASQRVRRGLRGAQEPGGVTADALTGAGLARALAGVEAAYYLIHSMERAPAHGRQSSFPERERIAAENFAATAARAGVRRLVYLGGPTADWTDARGERDETPSLGSLSPAALSPHLRSREAVERILRDAIPDTVVLRASIVIGSRSRSFRFLVRLVERMPVLALPAWHTHRTRPIDARDVIDMLAACASVAAVAGRTLDIGGPEILSYGEMIRRIAEEMLLARPTVKLGVNMTSITARIAAAITDEDPELVIALMEGLRRPLAGRRGWHGAPAGRPHAGSRPALLRCRCRTLAARVGVPRRAHGALIQNTMSLVTTSIHIDARPDEVWKVVMDPARLGDWVTIHRGLGRVDTGAPRVGYKIDQHIHLRGVSLDVHWTLVECDPGARAVWEGRGPARSRARTEYALRPRTGARGSITATSFALRSGPSARSSAGPWRRHPQARGRAHARAAAFPIE